MDSIEIASEYAGQVIGAGTLTLEPDSEVRQYCGRHQNDWQRKNAGSAGRRTFAEQVTLELVAGQSSRLVQT